MDQAIIHTPGLCLRPGVTLKDDVHEAFLQQVGRYQINNNKEGEENWITVKLGPEIAARLVTRKIGDDWICSRIHVFLPRWLWGHNGIVITTQEVFLAGLSSYYEVVSQLVEKGQEHRVLPGLGEKNGSYWQSIEFPVHVADPGKRLLRALENASHDRIRKTIELRRGESVTLPGTNLRINAYLKGKQLGSSFETNCNDPVLRVEVKWSEEELMASLGSVRSSSSTRLKPSQFKPIKGFSLATLYKAFLAEMQQMKGVFVTECPKTKASYMAMILATISVQKDIPIDELRSLAQGLDMRGEKAMRSHFSEARKLIPTLKQNHVATYFPEQLPPSQPCFVSKERIQRMQELEMPSFPVRDDIRKAYHDVNCEEGVQLWHPGPQDTSRFQSLADVEKYHT